MISGTVPIFLISPFAGVWADRYNKKNLINIADGFIAMFSVVIAIVFSMGYGVTLTLLVCAAARGFGQGVQTPAVSALIPEIVPEDKLMKVNGINSTIQSVCMLTAPMLAGALLVFAKIQNILFIDAATAVFSILLLSLFVKTNKVKKENTAIQNFFNEVKDGLNYVKSHTVIKRLILINVVFNFLIGPLAVLTPLQVVRDFGGEPYRLVAIEVSFCAGFLLGGTLIAVWGGFKNKIFTIAAGAVVCSVSAVIIGITKNFAVYLACMLIIGISVPMYNSPSTVITQTKVSPDYMGRTFSILTMVQTVIMPLGMLVWGPLGDIVSIGLLILVSGIGLVPIIVFLFSSKIMREAGKPDEKPLVKTVIGG
jgi:DHA3 family macrolide efflux protein-like MFS transporter